MVSCKRIVHQPGNERLVAVICHFVANSFGCGFLDKAIDPLHQAVGLRRKGTGGLVHDAVTGAKRLERPLATCLERDGRSRFECILAAVVGKHGVDGKREVSPTALQEVTSSSGSAVIVDG